MSTVSTKYVPIKQQQHNIRPTEGSRPANLPEKANSVVQKSSICFAENRPEADPDVLLHSTKELHYDVMGEYYMNESSKLHADRMNEKEKMKELIKDLRGVHYELGSDQTNLQSTQKEHFPGHDSNLLIDNKKSIIATGKGPSGKTNVTNQSERDVNAWKNNSLQTTAQLDYASPYQQMKKNLEGGKTLVPEARKRGAFDTSVAPERQVDTSLFKDDGIEAERRAMSHLNENIGNDRGKIVREMRTSHFFFGDESPSRDTTTSSSYGPKQSEAKAKIDTYVSLFLINVRSALLRSKSNIVLGDEKDNDTMMTSYQKDIGEKSKEYNHTPQSKQASVQSRNTLRDTMRGTSVILGSDSKTMTTHYDGEFRHIKYQPNSTK